MISTPAQPDTVRARHALGFWVVAGAFLIEMAFSTVPTPLYPLYQQRDGFATFLITVIFAAYAVGVAVSLFLAGHISDWVGRRRMIFVSLAAEAVAAVLFLASKDVPELLVARFVCGLGIGALTATATAHLAELRATARPDEPRRHAATFAGAINLGGLAFGPLIGGVLAQYVAHPLVVPYAVFLVLIVLAAAVLVVVPETVQRRAESPTYRPQRVSVPPGQRGSFFAAAVGAAAAFSVLGVFTSLTASFVGGTLHVTSHLAAGATVFAVMGASALSQVVCAALTLRRQLQVGAALMVVGMLGIAAVGAGATSLALFVISGAVAGAGVGLVFRSALGVAAGLAGEHNRGEVLAGMFLFAYAGLTIPVIAVGVVLEYIPTTDALCIFALFVLACIVASSTLMLRRIAAD